MTQLYSVRDSDCKTVVNQQKQVPLHRSQFWGVAHSLNYLLDTQSKAIYNVNISRFV